MSFELVNQISSTTSSSHLSFKELSVASEFNIPNLFRFVAHIEALSTIPDLMKSIEYVVGRPILKTIPFERYSLVVFDKFLVSLSTYPKPFEVLKRPTGVALYGNMEEVERVYWALKQLYPRSNKSNIDWLFNADRKIERRTMELEHKNIPHDSFFPWIKPNIKDFQQAFIDSPENILVLIGTPGTGKTSFIRDLINNHDLSTAVTYDEDLMKMDSFFIDFINKPYDLLVLEDADVILLDREGGNKVMNKLLNASDGLIQTRKKIIFSANITNLNDIDPALIRPGRCFETLVFRELSHTEAKVAAQDAGLLEPDGPKTLAELFSSGPATKVTSRMGFSMPRRELPARETEDAAAVLEWRPNL